MPLHDVSETTSSPPPGFEIGYAQITVNTNVTDTSESTATALITVGPTMFDGGPVIVTFSAATVLNDTAATGDLLTFSLFEGSTQIARLAQMTSDITAQATRHAVVAEYRFTPTAGLHTYKLTAVTSSTTGTPLIAAGTGGTGGYSPAFLRFTKV